MTQCKAVNRVSYRIQGVPLYMSLSFFQSTNKSSIYFPLLIACVLFQSMYVPNVKLFTSSKVTMLVSGMSTVHVSLYLVVMQLVYM